MNKEMAELTMLLQEARDAEKLANKAYDVSYEQTGYNWEIAEKHLRCVRQIYKIQYLIKKLTKFQNRLSY